MKILLTQFFSAKNKGDAAITSVMLSELRKIFPGSEILISTTADINESLDFEGARQIKSLFFFAIYEQKAAIFRILRTLYMFLTTTIWSIAYRATKLKLDYILPQDLKILLSHYITSDFIIFKGGGYINGRNNMRDNISLLIDMHEILLLKILGRETILYSQSIGPLGNKFQKFVTRWVLNKTDIIFAREQKTINLLKEIGVTKPQIIKTVDAAFLFTTDKKEEMKEHLKSLGVDTSKKIVGITAREWLDDIAQEKFESELAKFVDYLISKMDMQVLLVPQVVDPLHNEDDAAVNNNIRSKIQSTHGIFVIKDGLDHYETKGIYENLDLLVGTRMHSCIFALSGNIPVIPIEYEYKASGIMNDLGLGEWVIKIEEVTADRLIKMFLKFTAQKDDYLKTLTKNISFYINEAQKTTQLLKENIKNLKIIPELHNTLNMSLNKSLSITIGIPTYEASNSLVVALQSIYNQTIWNQISEVLVVIDGNKVSEDVLRKIANPKLKLSYSPKREGQSSRINDIFRIATGNLVVLTNDDVILKADAIEKMFRAWQETESGLLAGHVLPLPAQGYLEKILEIQNKGIYKIINRFKNGDNYLACNGRLIALSSDFAKSLKLPGQLKNNDAYIFISSKIQNIKFMYVPEAVCYFRNPSRLNEYFKQSTKFRSSLIDNSRFLPKSIADFYQIPKYILIQAFLAVLIENPFKSVIYILLKSYAGILSEFRKKTVVNQSGIWEIDKSTKSTGVN